jgi:hypothetical protein
MMGTRAAPTKQMNMLQALNNALGIALATDDKAGPCAPRRVF